MRDAWNPTQYEQFHDERSRPFRDLIDMVHTPGEGDLVVDLGCGTGRLTATLAERWPGVDVTGIDNSPAMLRDAPTGRDRLRFVLGDIGDLDRVELDPDGGRNAADVIIANAALHWLPDHAAVLAHWSAHLAAGGQLAVQVPANADHPAHEVAQEVAEEPRFVDAMGGDVPADPVRSVLAPERYAELLDEFGFVEQRVRLEVYGFHLPSTRSIVDWIRGTNLTRFKARMTPADFDAYLDRYGTRLVEVIGDRQPYFYPFKRILFHGRRGG